MKNVHRVLLLAALVSGLALFGCSSSSKGENDSTGSNESDSTTSGDLIQRGDGVNQEDTTYVPLVECTTDEECFGENRVCDCQGRCADAGTKPCEEDKNCGGGAFCDPCVKWCFPQGEVCDPCSSENLCNPITGECRPVGDQCTVEGSHCLDYVSGGSFCGRACLSDAGCPMGYTCMDLSQFGIELMQCVPNEGSCDKVRECEADTDCLFGEICNPMHQCVKGCEVDTECPSGNVCISARCVEACDPVNNPCDDGLICNEKGKCLPPGGCADAYDCPVPETYCDPDTSMCEDGCMLDMDCKSAAKLYEGGECVKRGCTATYWCSFGEVCELETGDCVIPPEPFCATCEEDAECGEEPSKCLELQDEDGNSQGKFCFVACYSDPANRCPQGYQCTQLQDQNGASQGEVCARTCYKEPVGLY